MKSSRRYTETALDEIKLLRTLKAANPGHPGYANVVSFLDSFEHMGVHNQAHVCMVSQLSSNHDVYLCDPPCPFPTSSLPSAMRYNLSSTLRVPLAMGLACLDFTNHGPVALLGRSMHP